MSSNSPPDGAGRFGRLVTIAGVVLALAAAGAYQRATAPASNSDAVNLAAAQFRSLPLSIDGWKATETEVNAKQLQIAESQTHLSRTYTKAGQAVSVLVLYGEPGPLGAHTPDVCYKSNGHVELGRPARITVPGRIDELWTTQFKPPGTAESIVEVLWGWGCDGTWAASDSPRLDFAGQARIFKLYVSRRLPATAVDSSPNEFLQPLLRELQIALTNPHPVTP